LGTRYLIPSDIAVYKSNIPIARWDEMKRNGIKAKEIDDILYRNAKGIFLLLEGPTSIGDIVRYLAGEDTKSKRGQVNAQKRRIFSLKLNGKDAISDSYGLTPLASAKKGREVIDKGDRRYVHDKRLILKGLVPEVYDLISGRLADSLPQKKDFWMKGNLYSKHDFISVRRDMNALFRKKDFREAVFGSVFWTKAFRENKVNDKVFFPFQSLMGFVNFAMLSFLCRYHMQNSCIEYEQSYRPFLNTIIRIVARNSRLLHSGNVGNPTDEEIDRFEKNYNTGKSRKDIGSALRYTKKYEILETLERNINEQLCKKISGKVNEKHTNILERYFSLHFNHPFRELIEEGLDMEKVLPFKEGERIPIHRLLKLDYQSRLDGLLSA
jgi:hypothetical protein